MLKRLSNREFHQPRDVSIETGVLLNSKSSCIVKTGNTHVICSATVEENVPGFLRGQKQGWLTAEFNMLPCSTNQRTRRDISSGKLNGRTQEIQRLISRSLRSAIDLKALGERQIIVDCDVINADGGTRTAAITGGYVAINLAISNLIKTKKLVSYPITSQIAAISCGIYNGQVVTDLDYQEDSEALVDANFVLTANGSIIEVQASAEKGQFTEEELARMLQLAKTSIVSRFNAQNACLLGLL